MEYSRKISILSLSLLIIGLVTALIWRLEVEYHGWEGLIWISYFHWAIPFGAFLFILWVLFTAHFLHRHRFNFWRLLYVLIVLGFLSVIFYYLALYSLTFLYIQGPRAFILFLSLGLLNDVKLRLIRGILWIILASLPFWLYLTARHLGFITNSQNFVISMILYIRSSPCSILLLEPSHHTVDADFLHSIKSGFIIPYLFISFGVIFLPLVKTPRNQLN